MNEESSLFYLKSKSRKKTTFKYWEKCWIEKGYWDKEIEWKQNGKVAEILYKCRQTFNAIIHGVCLPTR